MASTRLGIAASRREWRLGGFDSENAVEQMAVRLAVVRAYGMAVLLARGSGNGGRRAGGTDPGAPAKVP